jgi:hypothetical protein
LNNPAAGKYIHFQTEMQVQTHSSAVFFAILFRSGRKEFDDESMAGKVLSIGRNV